MGDRKGLSLGLGSVGLAMAIVSGLPAFGDEVDRQAILAGVNQIILPGLPGSLAIYEPGAQAIVVGKTGGGAQVAVVGASRAGKGRIVALSHEGYFKRTALEDADTGRLLENAVRWAGAARTKASRNQPASPRVGMIRQADLLAHLQAAGLDAMETQPGADWSGFDVIVAEPDHLGGASGIAVMRRYVSSGGGLVTAATGWGWVQINRQPIRQFAGNVLLAGTGLAWTEGMADPTGPQVYTTGDPISPAINAGVVLSELSRGQRPSDADILTGLEAVRLTLGSLPSSQTRFSDQAARVLRSMASRDIDLVPTAKNPATASTDRLRRFAVGVETALAQADPAARVKPLAAAADFPGLPEPKARPVTRSFTIDTSIPGWHSLGLYAAPGAKITVTLASDDVPLKLAVQIGSHTDQLWHLDRWERLPAIVRHFPIDSPKVLAANAMGGLVYIDVPSRIASARPVRISVAGAVEAPLFQLGSTSTDEWQETIRNRPAPWAELAGQRVIFTVPSALIRELDDPEPLMAWWDAVVETQVGFAQTGPLKRPERIVADRQISAGYMHSGYPIMVPIDQSATHALDLARLQAEGTWGHLHELGHNFQNRDWTFDGTVEVTNNLLVLHTYDTLLKLPFDAGHNAIRGKTMRTERIIRHLAEGSPFEKWKSDPFLGLMMYVQLYEAFGWEPFQRVFAEYAGQDPSQRPQSDDAKRDLWLVRMSRAVDRDLGPFFQVWGIPTSQAARDEVKSLPAWMPEELATPPKP